MDGQVIGQQMIERYAKKRSHRLFRAEDGEYLILTESTVGPFRAYMHPRGSSPDVVKCCASPFVSFPHLERDRLLELVNRFNNRNQWLTASVRDTHDMSRLRVVGNSRLSLSDEADFGVFVRFVDLSLETAAKLFETVDREMKLPSPAELQHWIQLSG